jgi:hypothetical protein
MPQPSERQGHACGELNRPVSAQQVIGAQAPAQGLDESFALGNAAFAYWTGSAPIP